MGWDVLVVGQGNALYCVCLLRVVQRLGTVNTEFLGQCEQYAAVKFSRLEKVTGFVVMLLVLRCNGSTSNTYRLNVILGDTVQYGSGVGEEFCISCNNWWLHFRRCVVIWLKYGIDLME